MWNSPRYSIYLEPSQNHQEWYKKAYETGLKAIEIDSSHYGGHKWCGIALGSLGDFLGTTEMITNSFKIREYFDTADSLTTGDPTIKHALGKWCYKIASIGWAVRTAASAIFATPPTSTYEEALDFFLACHAVVQNNIRFASIFSSNCLLIGQTYQGLKNTEKAKEFFQICLDLPVEGAGEQIQLTNKKQAAQLLSQLNSSWW
eukprot:TRINITY_DN8661_c0_g2_i4.p1 TRINITY_DN8661_c0_g2~~TRINITY_DN8661_c0_g2_i4.p1  ORF type:complete len:203 (-),score=19.22 TRINITY_DN8661_c0_g2_i4:43-651(-)